MSIRSSDRICFCEDTTLYRSDKIPISAKITITTSGSKAHEDEIRRCCVISFLEWTLVICKLKLLFSLEISSLSLSELARKLVTYNPITCKFAIPSIIKSLTSIKLFCYVTRLKPTSKLKTKWISVIKLQAMITITYTTDLTTFLRSSIISKLTC